MRDIALAITTKHWDLGLCKPFQVVTFLFALFLIMAAVDVNKAAIAQAKRDNTDSGMPSVVYTILLLLVVLLYLKVLFDLIFVGAVLKVSICFISLGGLTHCYAGVDRQTTHNFCTKCA